MKPQEIYSEKLGKTIVVSDSPDVGDVQVILEDTESSLVGWSHGGWNNSSGGGSC